LTKKKSKFTTPAEYREKSRKSVELPSGATFEIRKISPLVYSEILEKIGVKPLEADNPEAENIIRERILDVMKYAIPKCVVRPRIAISPDVNDESVLDFDDLDLGDVRVLLDVVYEFSGLTPEANEERENFREE